MDKQLRNLNFDDKIQTVFSDEGRQNVVKRIKKLEKKPRLKLYIPKFVSTLVVTGVLFLGIVLISNEYNSPRETNTGSHASESINESNSEDGSHYSLDVDNNKDPDEIINGIIDEFSKDQLKVDAYVDRQDSTYNPYNYSLYMAHLDSAVMTGNYFYHSAFEGPPNTIEEIQLYLESILEHLNMIVYEEESEERIKEVIELTNHAIERKANLDDPIYDEIHDILHQLDEYYNMNPFIDDITTEGGAVVPEKIRDFEAEARESKK
ncbi:hypothetical protein [Paucisalibacillus globulus]|uniref:hypothetical protein n=1 Tax=Paucisalibacillus globulus TaxID=351095 RepID=UPI000BB81B76|nr:hypothetical protein [Paucisalibacillus globulus]